MYTELLSQFLKKLYNSHYIINKVSQKTDAYDREKKSNNNKTLLMLLL